MCFAATSAPVLSSVHHVFTFFHTHPFPVTFSLMYEPDNWELELNNAGVEIYTVLGQSEHLNREQNSMGTSYMPDKLSRPLRSLSFPFPFSFYDFGILPYSGQGSLLVRLRETCGAGNQTGVSHVSGIGLPSCATVLFFFLPFHLVTSTLFLGTTFLIPGTQLPASTDFTAYNSQSSYPDLL